MTYGHLQADCLYTGISSGLRAQCSVSSMGILYLFYMDTCFIQRNVGATYILLIFLTD